MNLPIKKKNSENIFYDTKVRNHKILEQIFHQQFEWKFVLKVH